MLDKGKYRLYVDEIGISGFPKKLEEINDRYFGLCGVILEQKEAEKLSQMLFKLRNIINPDLDDASSIHLHRRDIVLRKGEFKVLNNEILKIEFDTYLLKIFEEIDFKIIFIGFDKKPFIDKGNLPINIYHNLTNILIEKYILELENMGVRGDVMFECSGPKEDLLLQKEFQYFTELGSTHFSPARIQNSITSKNIKFKNKDKNIAGLELADLLAFVALNNLLDDNNLKKLREDTFNFQIFTKIIRKFAFKGNLLI